MVWNRKTVTPSAATVERTFVASSRSGASSERSSQARTANTTSSTSGMMMFWSRALARWVS